MDLPVLWECEVCNYIHTGETPPEVCPVCGVGQDMFTRRESVTVEAKPAEVSAWRCTLCDYVHEGSAPPEECPVCGAEAGLFEPVKDESTAAEGAADVEKIVILGAGVAGMTAAEHARRTAPGVAITLVSGEAGLPYLRLNLTRFLAGEVSEASLVMQPEAWFSEHCIDLIPGEATAIDRQTRQVHLRDGRTLAYDRLVLATGSHAFVPPIPGAELANVRTVRTLEDTRALLGLTAQDAHAVCVGGGLLGLETAGALARQGMRVTVLEGHEALLPRQLAAVAGRLLKDHLESIGITVRCEVRVQEVRGRNGSCTVRLKSGEEIQADLVVLATGVRPNSSLARQCGLEVECGVVVDDRMKTSDPNVLACGDVAEHLGVVYGIWPTSHAQGMVAGINAVGGRADFHRLPPSNTLKVLDVHLFSIGEFQPRDASYEVQEDLKDGVYRRLVCRDGRLVGANLFGDIDLAGEIKEAVETGKRLQELGEILK